MNTMNNRLTYSVKPGDSLWTIANRYNISVEELKDENNLETDLLSIGQELIIPNTERSNPTTLYTVEDGDSLWKIAQQYNTTIDEIKRINNLYSTNLQPGQQLQIPTTPIYTTYTVQLGDSIWSIAKKYGLTVDELKNLNNLESNQIYPGDVLKIGPGKDQITYIVKDGDSLWTIANAFGMSVEELIAINQLKSNEIFAGQTLTVIKRQMPPEVTTITYIVKSGDSIWEIANKFGTTVEEIKAINGLTNNNLQIDQKLILSKTITPIDAIINIKVKRYNGTIEQVPLEEYVTGVVGSELSAGFDEEAYKAQALAARTYAVKLLREGKTISDTASHQVYKDKAQLKKWWGDDYDKIYQEIRLAVSKTKGEVITYDGKLIEALFFSTSNGRTEEPEHIWGGSLPYLRSVDSNWDTRSPHYYDVKNLTYSQFRSRLGLSSSSNLNANVISRTNGDSVDQISISGKTFTGEEVRRRLALKSTDFDIKFANGNATIRQRGWGHQVGLSQYGSHFMGKEGYGYRDIIQHYYPGVTIENLYHD